MLAPVILFVYNRYTHTMKTLEALKKNSLAKQSQLFIFSDGAKSAEDKTQVNRVRELIKKFQDCFLNTEIFEAEKNQGLANSVIAGVSKIISRYGKVIVLEDDLVTSPYFLSYMNQTLDYFEHDDRIWSVSGYVLPMKSLKKYQKDVFLTYRGCSWGWGTWENRWDIIDWSLPDYDTFKTDKQQMIQFKRGGKDLIPMLEEQMNGRLDSWAIRWCFWQSKCDMLTVYPRISLVDNIGCDHSGTNETNRDVYGIYEIEQENKTYQLSGIKIDNKIVKEFYEIYSATLLFRIRKKLRNIFLEKNK